MSRYFSDNSPLQMGKLARADSINNKIDAISSAFDQVEDEIDHRFGLANSTGRNLILPDKTTVESFLGFNSDDELDVFSFTFFNDAVSAAQQSASDSAASASQSSSHSDKSQKWAEEDEDVEVEVGQYSSKHHAIKTKASENAALASENKAQKWAEENEDTAVESGQYSSKHWAMKAHQWAQTVSNSLVFRGGWDASSGNAPTPSLTPETADYYKITVAGTIGSIAYNIGDNIIWDTVNDVWFKVDNTDAVLTVNGAKGDVIITAAGLGAYYQINDVLTDLKSVDGAGSGLDADTVDGIHASQLLRSDVNSTMDAHLTFNNAKYLRFGSNVDVEHFFNGTHYYTDINNGGNWIIRDGNSSNTTRFTFDIDVGSLTATTFIGSLQGNADSASNADTVDSLHASSFIRSDANDNVSAHTEWQDGYNIRLGNSADLRMHHTSNNNYFDLYTGNLYIRDSTTIRFTFEKSTGNFTTSGEIDANALKEAGTLLSTKYMAADHSVTKLASNVSWGGAGKFFTNDGGGNIGIRFGAHPTDETLSGEDGTVWEIEVANDAQNGDMVFLADPSVSAANETVQYTEIVRFHSDTKDITCQGDVTAYSDVRLKENIERIQNGLNKVCRLNGYTFDRSDVEMPRQTGVIAQEVLKVLPEAVKKRADDKLAVSYGNMVGLLIEAIKELRSELDEVKRVM